MHIILISKSRNVYTFLFTIIIWGNSASHSLQIVMLARTLKQEWANLASYSIVRVHEGSLYLPNIKIYVCFMYFKISDIILSNSASHFLEMIMLIS